MSVRMTRTATVVPGKLDEAMAYIQDITGYLAANHGIEGWLGVQIGTAVGTVQWHADFDDLGAVEEFSRKTMADPAFRAKIKGAEGLFIAAPEDAVLIGL